MSRQKNQKIKILILLDYIRYKARGKENAATTKQLCRMLEEQGIPCDRRTLASDMTLLEEYTRQDSSYDFTISCFHCYEGNAYYSYEKEEADRLFSFEELKTLAVAVNHLHHTDNITKEKYAEIKQKLMMLSDPRDRSILQEYADDENTAALDTVAAKILIDSVNSLTFMGDKMSEHIIDTIIRLSDTQDRKTLAVEKNNPVYRRHSSSGITIYDIDRLLRAVDQQKRICFKYFDLNENKEKVYRHGGKEYTVEPLTMTRNDNYYYLICYDDCTANHMRTFRLDRMSNVKEPLKNKSISEEAKLFKEGLPAITSQIFRMYSGEVKKLTLEFADKLTGSILDKFGIQAEIVRIDEKTCSVTQEIQVSPPFWGWIFQFGTDIRITAPIDLAEEYRNRCRKIIGSYQIEDQTMKEQLRSGLIEAIGKCEEADIYAFSLFVYNEFDDPCHPAVVFGYNTEENLSAGVEMAPDPSEARWNYAYWKQNELFCFGTDETRRAVEQWLTENDLPVNCDAVAEELYPSVKQRIKDRFETLLARIIREIHSSGMIAEKFGVELPILIHEDTYYERLAEHNIEANGEVLADEFVKFCLNG